MLTGKCKELFNEWIHEKYSGYEFYDIMNWDEHIFSMQYGVYVDFFDSLEVGVTVGNKSYFQKHHYMINESAGEGFKTRDEARKAAVTKSNEIVNNRV